MLRYILAAITGVALWLAVAAAPASAQAPQPRIALVIGNGAYARGPLQASLNDAGLVAEALRSVGFEIVEGADLGQADFVRAARDFVGKLEAAGPAAVAFVYFSGYGFAYDGDNYLAAADARLDREDDIALDTVRLSDLLRALDGVPTQAKIVVVDAARRLPFGIAEARLATGLSALEPPSGMLIAYSSEPGMIFEDGPGPYGAYATAIAEMLRIPGADIAHDFVRIRERVHQLAEGRQLPWNVSALDGPVVLVPEDAAPVAAVTAPLRQPRSMREFGPEEGYAFAIERDDLVSYAEYVEAYPNSHYASRIWSIIRMRREALAWMRAVDMNTPRSYWTYLGRYPNGLYAADAERRLRRLAAPLAPPSSFVPVELAGVSPRLPSEPVDIVDYYRLARPPRPPVVLIAPQPALFSRLAPSPQAGMRALPVPTPLPVVPSVNPSIVPAAAIPGTAATPGVAAPGAPSRPAAPPAIAPVSATVPPKTSRPVGPLPAVAPGNGPALPPTTAPAALRTQPPPPVLHRPVQVPAPQAVNRPPPASSPAAVARPAPSAPAAARPPAPAQARKTCVVENGTTICR